MIRYLQLPFHFDAALMQQEVATLDHAWQLHFNQRDYEGNWSGLPLRSPSGVADNLLPEQQGRDMPFEDTALLTHCPYIQQLLQLFKCELTSVRLLKLATGAIVKLHKDEGLNFEQGEVRLHIPVYTHPEVEFYLDGDRLHMQEGSCWYINASLPHRLANPSPVNRIHLVIDCMVNNWVTNLFNDDENPVRSVKDTSMKLQQQQMLIIEMMRASNDPIRVAMADTLELQYAAGKSIDDTMAYTADVPLLTAEEQAGLLDKLVAFVRSIGITVSFGKLDETCFLPGLCINDGAIIIDHKRLLYPGDLLHEAGHIAVVPLTERESLNAGTIGNRQQHAAEEMMAIAWSYAAVVHLGIDPHIVFHAAGYKQGGESLLQSFANPGAGIGVPMLQYHGMTNDAKRAVQQGIAPFPTMVRWVLE